MKIGKGKVDLGAFAIDARGYGAHLRSLSPFSSLGNLELKKRIQNVCMC